MLRQPLFSKKNILRLFASLFLLILPLILVSNTLPHKNPKWHSLTPGIEYLDLAGGFLTPWSHIHVFKIDLKHNQLALVTAKEIKKLLANADEFANKRRALIAINGGFFDKKFNPLGLRITHYKTISSLKNISWWGVFYIKNRQAHIVSKSQFSKSSDISFAIQAGPRLLINGHSPHLKPGRAQRTALGINHDGKLIILVTDNSPLSTVELAEIMKRTPLNCDNAINLDGGSSTQLHANFPDFQLSVHGFANVSDAIIVKPTT